MSELTQKLEKIKKDVINLTEKYDKLKKSYNPNLIKENNELKQEIIRLKTQNNVKNQVQTQNIILIKQPTTQIYENDERFSDYIFKNPYKEKNKYIKEDIKEFLKNIS